VDGFAGELGVQEERVEVGRARLELEVGEAHMNPAGTLHGGVLATLVDTAMASAARSSTDDGQVPATSQLTIAFLSAGHPGRVVVNAQVRTQGDHLLVCDADVEQNGRALVHAVATFAVLERSE
jgi:uncharacterized protein (TIGR00369 family)